MALVMPMVTITGGIKPIIPFQRKGTTLFTEQSPPHRVFPVGSMQRHFPDIVSLRLRTPNDIRDGKSTERTSKIGPVPGFPVEGLIDQSEKQVNGFVHTIRLFTEDEQERSLSYAE